MNPKKGMNKRIRALLIFPRNPGIGTSNDAIFPFPFLSLTQLAAGFPSNYEVKIVDERICPSTGKESADIVLITTLTATAYRAYDLGDIFKQRGIPVVIGGVHATTLPEEASLHATSVVVGEAEEVIQQVLADFEKGSLAPYYRAHVPPELDSIPSPSLRLLRWQHKLSLLPIQTSRGCPNNCNFCCVPTLAGHKMRLQSVEAVEKQLKLLQRTGPRKHVMIVDDNFTIQKDRALAIMDLFRFYRIKWTAFSTLSSSEDETFLKNLRDSGCVSLFIGFESLEDKGHISKNRNYRRPEDILEAVGLIHRYGIGIQGSFIFGFEEDTPEVFRETVSFIQKSGIELPNINILTPFPGTRLFDSLQQEDRLIHKNWSMYDMNHAVFRPRNMSAQELQQGYVWALKYLASPTVILSRLKRWFGPVPYFLLANFSLHRYQTRLARSLWNSDIQASMQKRGLCTC